MNFPELLKKYPDIFFVSFVEGAIVLLVELVAVNLITPYYGVSIYLWAGVLCATLSGLAAGYFVAASLSVKKKSGYLYLAGLGVTVFSFLLPYLSAAFIPLTFAMEMKTGITVSCFVLVFPCLFMCGLVSPLIIQLINLKELRAGNVAGTVFTVSTTGGVLMTLLAGLVFIPTLGIKATLLYSSLLMLLSLLISAMRNMQNLGFK
jgi:hypothetical protein